MAALRKEMDEMSNLNELNLEQLRKYITFFYHDPDFEQVRIDLSSGVLPSVNGLVALVALTKYCYLRYMVKNNVLDTSVSPAGFMNPFHLETR